jgi:hypothetical protein
MSEVHATCEDCGAPINFAIIPEDCLKHPDLPNTLSGLKDHQNVDWKCPHCGFWHLSTPNQP